MMNTRLEELGLKIGRRGLNSPRPLAGEGLGVRVISQSSILNPQSCKGFTLIEFVVVITIIVVLGGIFLTRVPLYQEQAEKAAMQQVEGVLQSALVLRFGALMARGVANEKELHTLASDNPITWLQKIPPNYKGEYYDPSIRTVAPGNWMFDLKSRELVYFVDHADNFKAGKDGNNWIRFHVHLDYEPMLGHPKSGKELVTTLFEPTEPYHWLE
jgi:prepilin-type N-terminal cleavage/methylation domain-containing protein